MAQKDLIIGAFSNYDEYQVLKPWVQSIHDTGFRGDIVLIAVDAPKPLIDTLSENGVIVIPVTKQNDMMIHMLRFVYIYDYLNKHVGEYRNVVSTDVRDVIFQKNPFDHYLMGSDIIASSEAILIKDEPWNRDNIIKNYGEYFYNSVKDKQVYNVGILAGTADHVCDLCFHIYQMSLGRPDWVADQAAYNVLIAHNPWKEFVYKAGLSEAWAINAHVTNKPDQMEQFSPFLLEGRPRMEDGLVVNEAGVPFTIVHQYDRVPEWMEYFSKKYGTNITNETKTGSSPKYFTYNT